MLKNELLELASQAQKGRYVGLVKKMDLGNGVEKISSMSVRLGVKPSNMKVYKDAGKGTGSLPWGQWVKNYEGLVIENKGNYYLRVASSYNKKVKTKYIRNNQEITYSEAVALVGAKKMEGSKVDLMNIKCDNIIKLNLHKN